jgi:hypothetical protein
MKRIPTITVTPTMKGPNLVLFDFMESPSKSLLTIEFTKNNITSSNNYNLPRTAMAKIWPI